MTTSVRRAWIPAFFWLAVIAWESTTYGSSENTGVLLRAIFGLFWPHMTAAHFDLVHHFLRKAGHFVGYATLGLVMYRGWWATMFFRDHPAAELPPLRAMSRRWSARVAALAWLSTALVAVLDEWHQAFLPGRTSTWRDIALDSFAGLWAQGFIWLVGRYKTAARFSTAAGD
jgi:VanZ family protein